MIPDGCWKCDISIPIPFCDETTHVLLNCRYTYATEFNAGDVINMNYEIMMEYGIMKLGVGVWSS